MPFSAAQVIANTRAGRLGLLPLAVSLVLVVVRVFAEERLRD